MARLAAYTDYVYKRRDGAIYAQRAFALFLARLGGEVESLAITGRLDPEPGESYYRLPDDVEFVPLPHYEALSKPWSALPAMARSLGTFWRLLGRVDAVWLLGPYPLSFAFVLLAALRRRRIFLGVRQDWPTYVRSRHPERFEPLLERLAHRPLASHHERPARIARDEPRQDVRQQQRVLLGLEPPDAQDGAARRA